MATSDEDKIAAALAAFGGTHVESAQRLGSYFETADQQRRALNAVANEGWLDPGLNLDVYEWSQFAFEPSLSEDRAFQYFYKIYEELSGRNWQVFRPSSREECWQPRKIFETLKREFTDFSWHGRVNLATFLRSGTEPRLRSCLSTMEGIKPKQGYPVMTVSKFLHFYNPELFPIYDNKVISEKVLNGRFRSDFRGFREREGIPYGDVKGEDTVDFLPYYMRWAGSLLSARHEAFMQVFVQWLERQPGVKLRQRRFDVATLYATAFEFTVIGAASVS